MSTSATHIPFPVDGTYRIRADIAPLGGVRGREHGHLRRDHEAHAYVAAKLDALERGAPLLSACVADAGKPTIAAIAALAGAAALQEPTSLKLANGLLSLPLLGLAVSWDAQSPGVDNVSVTSTPAPGWEALQLLALQWLNRRTPLERLVDIVALSMQEDFAILRGPVSEGGDDAVELLHVCFPAGWTPVEKCGLPFDAVHQPVPDNSALLQAHRGLVKMMIGRGPFVRYVWGLHRSPDLCAEPSLVRHHADGTGTASEVAAVTYFRCERQTLLALPAENRAIFTIRTYTAPLTETVDSPQRAALLAASLRDMTEAVAEYKGVAATRSRLLDWLDTRQTAVE